MQPGKYMNAYIIDPQQQTVETTDVDTLADIRTLIGFDTIASDDIGNGDRLFFDEECFLRGSEGRFQIDTVIPVSGKGVIMASGDEGETLQDVATPIDDIRQRIRYL